MSILAHVHWEELIFSNIYKIDKYADIYFDSSVNVHAEGTISGCFLL